VSSYLQCIEVSGNYNQMFEPDIIGLGIANVDLVTRIEDMQLECSTMIRYGKLTEDEVFITAARAREGYTIENCGTQSPML